ncbi:hypothetical protein N7520_002349 [Penicillium odoratum]|uniref:uncharacterized protein n=1 Tax=Penicillium odoratum TaxID=1167516 RepID=UPI0025485621|nr:uncharacterized protein N7520_002349 [Penicillium odoratum]KAJ5771820.1 hypothetical protein N7520_002349 [Penicillium odoratum]
MAEVGNIGSSNLTNDYRSMPSDHIPGTEILIVNESNGIHRDEIILIPKPQNDPHDPLNWSIWWKYACLVNMLFLMFLGNFSTLSISPLTPVLMEQFSTTESKVAALTGACILALGYANFIIIPCVNIFGRRSTALTCMLICVGANIWQAVSTSYHSLLGARVLIGIGAASSESIMPVVISDLTFLHERGTWMATYFWAYFFGGWVGPIVSGSIADHVSWRWFFWLSTILNVVSFVGMFFGLPETKYCNKSDLSPDVRHELSQSTIEGTTTIGEKGSKQPSEIDIETQLTRPDLHPLLGRGYPSPSQRWRLWNKPDTMTFKQLCKHVLTPFHLAIFPITLFASLAVMAGSACLLVLNLTESEGFSRAPYNFSTASVGFTNFALMGGGIVGLGAAGPLSDWVSMVLTKRNNGVREPEMRLLTFIPFIAIAVVGMTVAAVGLERIWPWEVVVIIGFGFTGVIVMAIPTIATTYAIDSYKNMAGEIMVLATVAKNTFGYGLTYFIIPWATEHGYLYPIITVGMIAVGITLIGLILFFSFGKTFRRWTRNSGVHRESL